MVPDFSHRDSFLLNDTPQKEGLPDPLNSTNQSIEILEYDSNPFQNYTEDPNLHE